MAAARNVSAAHSSDAALFALETGASLPMVVVLPEPLTPTTRITAGGSATCAGARSLACENLEQMLADEALQFGCVVQLMPLDALADAFQDFLGGAHTHVGRDERALELVQQIGIDLFFPLERVLERGNQAGAGLLYAALELFEQ